MNTRTISQHQALTRIEKGPNTLKRQSD